MNSLHSYLVALGFKATSTPNEYLADECWHCGGRNKLYFNVRKLIGYCQKCSEVVDLKALVTESGGNAKDMKSVLETLDTLQRESDIASLGFRDAVYSRLMAKPNAILSEHVSELPTAELPDEFRTLKEGLDSVSGQKALAYLEGRGFKRKVLFDLGFGYCAAGFYGGRIIIPFKEGEKIVYWQARDYTGRQPSSSKILNPPKTMVSTGKSEVLFNYNALLKSEYVIICESWGSALAVGPYAIGLNGKSMSDTQFEKIKASKVVHSVIVLLDHGAESNAWRIAEQLSNVKPTLVATLPYGDPNEVPRSVLIAAIRDCQAYSKLNYVRSVYRILR